MKEPEQPAAPPPDFRAPTGGDGDKEYRRPRGDDKPYVSGNEDSGADGLEYIDGDGGHSMTAKNFGTANIYMGSDQHGKEEGLNRYPDELDFTGGEVSEHVDLLNGGTARIHTSLRQHIIKAKDVEHLWIEKLALAGPSQPNIIDLDMKNGQDIVVTDVNELKTINLVDVANVRLENLRDRLLHRLLGDPSGYTMTMQDVRHFDIEGTAGNDTYTLTNMFDKVHEEGGEPDSFAPSRIDGKGGRDTFSVPDINGDYFTFTPNRDGSVTLENKKSGEKVTLGTSFTSITFHDTKYLLREKDDGKGGKTRSWDKIDLTPKPAVVASQPPTLTPVVAAAPQAPEEKPVTPAATAAEAITPPVALPAAKSEEKPQAKPAPTQEDPGCDMQDYASMLPGLQLSIRHECERKAARQAKDR